LNPISIDSRHVVVLTDEPKTDSDVPYAATLEDRAQFWRDVAALGWLSIDHDVERIVELHGPYVFP
jgi:hypothetical protein